jgi:predicted enzyme related to lactoylglutathione lyase
MSAKSRFFWHDLMVKDVEKAKAFYGELFGWSFKTEKGEMPYTHIMRGETGVGGMMSLAQMKGGEHIPPHWLGYVNVDDVDATVKSVGQHGGKILSPKESLPEVGDWAVVADPTGAVVSPMVYRGKDAGRPESTEMPKAGEFCWDELATNDPDAAWKFYTQVFGWGHEAMEMPGWGTYHLLKRNGVKDAKGIDRNAGGVMKLQGGAPMPYWLSYIAVDDCDQSAGRAVKLGAKSLAPPMDIPDVGRFSVFMDPQQAAFAILAPPKK